MEDLRLTRESDSRYLLFRSIHLLAFAGALMALIVLQRDRAAWMLFTPIFVVSAVHVVFFSEPRFTFTAEPFAIVLAVAGVHHLILSRLPMRSRTVVAIPARAT